ncbi:poly(ADP-ribose) glycohydrolase-like [Pararge aegeria]|uniref:poly(ADP-ribose) glycohydrolase-like n=1 Tax=Pararge aegeria TaxID=116150 RepID=UPI0019D26186|nr:poly(ADP-ribose) glycohydrolase-like [Pararge aegeria]
MFKISNFITTILPSQCFLSGKIFKSIISCSTMAVDNDWKGVPMSHIIGSQSPWGAPEFPLVQPGFNHAVLYHIPGSGTTLDRPPKPQIGKDKWDQEHVRMPFSKESLYPVPNGAGKSDLRSRWEMIQDALNKPIRNTEELADTILTYNTQFKDRWGFRSLHKLFELLDEDESQYFFDVTLPEIAKLALALPKLVQSPIPLLKQHKNRSVSLSQQQISSLLANAFFCTYPRRNTHKKDAEYSSYPFINFNALYNCSPSAHVLEKIKCLCHYFRRVCQKVPVGVVTFSRRSVPPRTQPHWPSSDKLLSELPVHVDPQDTIEDAHGLIQVDFANKYLGGGVLGNGSVQEEIRFVICPELLISMLFTEYMRPNEALIMIGCEQFSTYTGYGHSFQWLGDYTDDCPYDSSGRRRCAVLAIDALPFHSQLQEHRKEAVDRELNKAWVGFSFFTPDDPGLNYPGVATGNWGCGAFGGTAALKSLIQMMALTQAGRPMAYYTFGDVKLRDDIMRVYNTLARHNVTVGGLYGLILEFFKTDVLKSSVYKYLEKVLDCKDSSSLSQPSKSKRPESIDLNAETEQYEILPTVDLAQDASPDLFDEDDSQFITPAKLKVSVNNENSQKYIEGDKMAVTEPKTPTSSKKINDTDHNISANTKKTDHKAFDSSHKMADQRMSTSPVQKAENDKSVNHTSRLFDEMEKLDEKSGKLNQKIPISSIFGQKSKKIRPIENIKTSDPTPISFGAMDALDESPHNSLSRNTSKHTEKGEHSKTSNLTSRLFDEMEKLDEDSGKLNLKSPQKSYFGQKSKQESAMDVDDNILSEVSPDVKKKLTRKITYYFSKKPI